MAEPLPENACHQCGAVGFHLKHCLVAENLAYRIALEEKDDFIKTEPCLCLEGTLICRRCSALSIVPSPESAKGIVEALEFYANEKNYLHNDSPIGPVTEIGIDEGQKANEALRLLRGNRGVGGEGKRED